MDLFTIISKVCEIGSFIGILFICYNSIRGKFLSAIYEGKELKVPTDEIKEQFRRAALAEVSRLNNGERVNLEVKWEGNKLIMEYKRNKQNKQNLSR